MEKATIMKLRAQQATAQLLESTDGNRTGGDQISSDIAVPFDELHMLSEPTRPLPCSLARRQPELWRHRSRMLGDTVQAKSRMVLALFVPFTMEGGVETGVPRCCIVHATQYMTWRK